MSQLSCFSLPIAVSYFPAFLLFHISFPFQRAPSFNFFFSCTFVVTSAAPTPALFVVCLVFLVTFFSYKFSSLKGFLLAFCRIQNGNTCYIQYLLLEFMPVLEKEEMMIILFNRNESMTPLLC